MTEKQETQVQMAIRFSESFVAQLDEIAEQLSRPGVVVTRVEALRAAAYEGVMKIRAERKKR